MLMNGYDTSNVVLERLPNMLVQHIGMHRLSDGFIGVSHLLISFRALIII
jgi:hypothetical protein